MKSIRDIFRNRLGMNKIYAKNFINHNDLQIFYIVINSMILIIQEHFFYLIGIPVSYVHL